MQDNLKPMLSVRDLVKLLNKDKLTNKKLIDDVFEWELWEIL